jgi:hypothetical protein
MGYRWCRVRKGRKGEEGREKKREEREDIRICCRTAQRAAQCSTARERVRETDRDRSHIPVPI